MSIRPYIFVKFGAFYFQKCKEMLSGTGCPGVVKNGINPLEQLILGPTWDKKNPIAAGRHVVAAPWPA